MYLRLHRWIALLGLTLAPNLYAQTPHEPAPLPSKPADAAPAHADSENQKMASAIAEHLKQSGHLRNYFVEVSFQDRTATLSGHVTDQMQKDEVMRLVQGMPNVERVIDRLVVPVALTQVRADEARHLLPCLCHFPRPIRNRIGVPRGRPRDRRYRQNQRQSSPHLRPMVRN